MPAAPFASIVIPAYNEGHRLPQMLHELRDLGNGALPATEFLVVDDGSGGGHRERYVDAVTEVSSSWERAGALHRIHLVSAARNQGKGASVRAGWGHSSAAATWLGFVDADGAVPAHEVWRLIRRAAEDDVDVVAGSRILMAGRVVRRNLIRHLQGRVFATAVDVTFRLGFYDTQCGLKLIRASMLRRALPSLREDRWMLDVELLLRLRGAGARCIEVPIDWADPGGSKVMPVIDPLRMFLAIYRLRRRLRGSAQLPP